MKNKGCDFGKYNSLTFRVCFGLTEDGKMDYSTPHYAFIKYCKCSRCKMRSEWKRESVNTLTVTTDDKERFPEVEKIIDGYTCNSDYYIGRKYVSMENGKVEEKICK